MTKFKQEDDQTEFKSELNDKLEKEVVAFLNSAKGGDIYIGISNDGRIIGVEDTDKLQLIISDRIKNNILPTCLGLYDVYTEEYAGKTIIHIIVSRGMEKPYYIKKHGLSPAGCYMRIGSGVQQMTINLIDSLYASRTRDSLRNIATPRLTEHSFRQLKIYYEARGYKLNKEFLKNLDLYTPDEKLNYVAYLLADNNSVSIKVAKYAGTDKCNLIENEEYGFCSLLKATNLVLDKLFIENRTFVKITGAAQRLERSMIDKTALREALINAIVHNDYTKEVPPVIEIYSDRLSITSYGGLVQGLSEDEFFAGRSMPRNRELMRVFRDMKLVEQLGSGIHRILNAYNKSIFKVSDNFLEICFPYEEDYLLMMNQKLVQSNKNITPPVKVEITPPVKVEITPPVKTEITAPVKVGITPPVKTEITPPVKVGITPPVKKMLIIINGEMSRQEIQTKLELTNKKYFIKKYLRIAMNESIIEMTIPDKPNSHLQKYRLTKKGLELKQYLL